MFAARIIGHRGCAAHAPENTLAGLREAAARGVAWVEIDVSLLGDGTPVIIHDATVDRTTNGRGALSALDWEQVSRLDAGSWFAPRFAGEGVPRLDEALEAARAAGLGVNVELKTHRGEGDALVRATVPAIKASNLLRERLLVASFDHAALVAFHARAPEVAIGILYRDIPAGWRALAGSLDAVAVNASYLHASEDSIREVKRAGLDVYLYTPNDPAAVAPMWGWGIDGVFTDDPDKYASL